jgi:hypothetical protein
MDNTNSKGGKNLNPRKIKKHPQDPFMEINSAKKHGQDIDQMHKDHLGMEIPEGYFATSKQRILDKVSSKEQVDDMPQKEVPKKRAGRIFKLNRTIAYPLAASLLLLIAIAIGVQRNSGIQSPVEDQETVVSIGIEKESVDDFLIRSLFVDDAQIDAFTTEYLVEQVVVEAELSEQQMENIFINSLFIDDSLVDDYLEESLLEQVVL